MLLTKLIVMPEDNVTVKSYRVKVRAKGKVKVEPIDIPPQLFYKIGQVSNLTNIKPHVLRYWESEFGLVKPRKDRRGQRLYRRSDIDIILHIKELLYNQRYSISGAKQKLKQDVAQKSEDKKYTPPNLQVIIDKQKEQIQELLNLLGQGKK